MHWLLAYASQTAGTFLFIDWISMERWEKTDTHIVSQFSSAHFYIKKVFIVLDERGGENFRLNEIYSCKRVISNEN